MLFVEYPKCTTCQRAKKFLDERGAAYTDRHIKEDNPTAEELRAWWKASGLPLKKFFNTSGMLYKSLELKDKLPRMGEGGATGAPGHGRDAGQAAHFGGGRLCAGGLPAGGVGARALVPGRSGIFCRRRTRKPRRGRERLPALEREEVLSAVEQMGLRLY